jgi:hypothetical protein
MSLPGRLRDAAALLPLLGTLLLMPPLISLFAVALDIAGVPLVVLYMLLVWLALIGCAAALAWRLRPRR